MRLPLVIPPLRLLLGLSTRAPRLLPLAVLALCLGLAAGIPGLHLDNSFAALFRQGDVHLEGYRTFQRQFGDDDFLAVLLLDPAGTFSPGCQATLFALHEALVRSPEVTRVRSLPALIRGLAPEAEAASAPEDLADLELSFGRSPLLVGDLLPRDLRGAALYALVRPGPPAARTSLIEAVRALPLRPGQGVLLAGPVAINHELDEGAQSDGRTFLPLAVLAASGTLLLLFGWAGLAPAGAALLATVAFLGLLGWSGRSLNMVTVALPPVLFLLDLAAGIHLLQACPPGRSRTPGRVALERVGTPILYCTLTTACGFLALLASDVRPVREMGLYGSAGLVFGLLVVTALVPAALDRVPARPRAGGAGSRWSRDLAAFSMSLRSRLGWAVAICALTLAAGGLGLTRLRTSLSALSFLRPDGEVRDALTRGERLYLGFSPGEVVVEAPPGTFLEPAALARLSRLEEDLARAAGADGTLGLTGLLRHVTMMDAAEQAPRIEDYRLPASRLAVQEILTQLPVSLRPELDQLIDPGRGTTRIQVRLPTRGGTHVEDVMARWTPRLAAFERETGWSTRVTGLVPMLVRMQSYLVKGFRLSFLFAALAIFLPLLLLTRDLRTAALAMVPNLVPVAVVLGSLDLLGYTLDAGTCMVASVALGIAVDDTLHLVHALVTRRQLVPRTMSEVGPALVWTTAAGCAGFGLLAFSSFPPMARFGVLTTATLVVALVADLCLLPLLVADAAQWAREDEAPEPEPPPRRRRR